LKYKVKAVNGFLITQRQVTLIDVRMGTWF